MLRLLTCSWFSKCTLTVEKRLPNVFFAQVSNGAGRCGRFKEQQQQFDLMDLVDGIGDGEWPDGYLGIILVDKRLPLVDQHESAQLPKWLLDQQRGSFASISEDALTVLLIDIVCVVAVEYANIKCVPLGSRVIRRLDKLVVDNRRPPPVDPFDVLAKIDGDLEFEDDAHEDGAGDDGHEGGDEKPVDDSFDMLADMERQLKDKPRTKTKRRPGEPLDYPMDGGDDGGLDVSELMGAAGPGDAGGAELVALLDEGQNDGSGDARARETNRLAISGPSISRAHGYISYSDTELYIHMFV